jgi:protocatechuate 3,4-dioxygenase beta subunit
VKFDAIAPGVYPELVYPAYKSTVKRGPLQPMLRIDAPVPVTRNIVAAAAHPAAERYGPDRARRERAAGRENRRHRPRRRRGRQAGAQFPARSLAGNSAGRYWHKQGPARAPLDPNFNGWGKMLTDDDGRYRFVTIKPGPYPWGNHDKAWRPAHIHFSLFGNVYAQRLVTQMYFPSDPLFDYDPIFQSVPDEAARQRLVSRFSLEHTVGAEMLGYEFDIVLRGRDATPMGL